MPKHSQWHSAQVDTLRLRFIKVAVRVVERKTRVVLSACHPDRPTPKPTSPPVLSDYPAPRRAVSTLAPGPFRLSPYSTPVRSPESNGISEAFVKTFKRDYVRVNPIPDAKTALDLIAGWFEPSTLRAQNALPKGVYKGKTNRRCVRLNGGNNTARSSADTGRSWQ